MPPLIEIKEPYALENNVPVYFKAETGTFTHFHFEINSPHIIKIQTWPLDRNSEPDLYVTVNQEEVNSSNYHWKSNKIGADEIVIDPDNPKF